LDAHVVSVVAVALLQVIVFKIHVLSPLVLLFRKFEFFDLSVFHFLDEGSMFLLGLLPDILSLSVSLQLF